MAIHSGNLGPGNGGVAQVAVAGCAVTVHRSDDVAGMAVGTRRNACYAIVVLDQVVSKV